MLAALVIAGKPNFGQWNFQAGKMSAREGWFEYSGSGA
jgi:hypothetical protein